ncbi:MAG TPA: phytanoyl-CoA dioxygenase family protein [Casimicrobiaceae bacterium]|nr:phytanoyl-CoA dioxygenase family protein [Casimicrobiaceae bacterium]
MTPQQVLSLSPRVLSQRQRERYFEDGFILLEGIVPKDWLDKLRAATDELVERSRAIARSDAVFDLEPDHTPANPRLRRVSSPVDQHPAFWDYLVQSKIGDIVADLVGPHVKYHQSKLNFKWAKGGEEVKWHYDISFWPHTNYSPLTVGTYLYDCGMDQGPVGFLPGSHRSKMRTQYDDTGRWIGCLTDRDVASIDARSAKYMVGPAGSVTIHNCRTVHGSPVNTSDRGRPLLLYVLSSADAFPYTANPIPSRQYDGAMIRGERARYAHIDAEPCEIPPDWSHGYTSIFALQQKEGRAAATAM